VVGVGELMGREYFGFLGFFGYVIWIGGGIEMSM
jgi:hypothetical protein